MHRASAYQALRGVRVPPGAKAGEIRKLAAEGVGRAAIARRLNTGERSVDRDAGWPGTISSKPMLCSHQICNFGANMIKSALLGMGLAAVVVTAAAAQPYYPYYYPGYNSYYSSYYSAPGWGYPAYSYPYGYSWYSGWPYSYPAPAYSYRPAPAYSDPYVAARPYSDGAGPRVSGHVGY
jgi:hypothetical protein